MGLFGGGNKSTSISNTTNNSIHDAYNSNTSSVSNWQNVGNVVISPPGNATAGNDLVKSLSSNGTSTTPISIASFLPYALIGLVLLIYMRYKG